MYGLVSRGETLDAISTMVDEMMYSEVPMGHHDNRLMLSLAAGTGNQA